MDWKQNEQVHFISLMSNREEHSPDIMNTKQSLISMRRCKGAFSFFFFFFWTQSHMQLNVQSIVMFLHTVFCYERWFLMAAGSVSDDNVYLWSQTQTDYSLYTRTHIHTYCTHYHHWSKWITGSILMTRSDRADLFCPLLDNTEIQFNSPFLFSLLIFVARKMNLSTEQLISLEESWKTIIMSFTFFVWFVFILLGAIKCVSSLIK